MASSERKEIDMHKIELSDDHLNIVGAALAELPFKIAQPVMVAIQKQLEPVERDSAREQKSAASV